MIESLAMMREKVRVEQNEPFQGKEIRETQPIFDKLKILGGIHLLTPVILLVIVNLCNGRLKGEMSVYQEREKKR